jgi:O-antigen/teichoic acid export membrane protein
VASTEGTNASPSIEQPPSSLRRLLTFGPGLLSMFVHGCSLAFRLAFMLLLLRFNSASVLGHYGLLVAIELVVIYLAGLEFHTFTTRRYAHRPSPSMLRLCFGAHRRMMLVSVPAAVILTLGAMAFLRVDLPMVDRLVFTLVVVSGVIAQELIRYMVLVQKPVHAVLVTFLRGAAWQPLMLPFIHSDAPTIHYTVLLWAAASCLTTLWALFVMRRGLSRHVRPRLRYLLRGVSLSHTYYTVAAATVIQNNLERFVLQLLLGPAGVGVFAFFQTLANTLPALMQSAVLNLALGRILTAFGARQETRFDYLRSLLAKCLKASLLISGLVCVVALPLLVITSRPEYLRLLWILPVLLVGQVLTTWTQPIHLALFGAHHDRILMIVSLVALGVSLALNYAMVLAFGMTGAVLAPLVIGASLAVARRQLLRFLQARDGI